MVCNMKLQELIKHIPKSQYIRICEYGNIISIGYADTTDMQQHIAKTVGLINVKNGILEINVSQK